MNNYEMLSQQRNRMCLGSKELGAFLLARNQEVFCEVNNEELSGSEEPGVVLCEVKTQGDVLLWKNRDVFFVLIVKNQDVFCEVKNQKLFCLQFAKNQDIFYGVQRQKLSC